MTMTIKTFIKRHPLLIFYALTFTISWGWILILGFIIFVEIAPWTANFMPWSLTNAVSTAQTAMGVALVLGQSIPTFSPLVGSLIGCIVFTLVAIWRFQKEEF